MKFYVGVTDKNWFDYLSQIQPENVNFWRPGGNTVFKALEQGAPFLFRLKSPINAIAGLGFFSSYSTLPINIVWEYFGDNNGASTFTEFQRNILRLRSGLNDIKTNPNVGCVVLTNPIFFREEDWIPLNWGSGIVQGKSFSTDEPIGNDLWKKIQNTLLKYPVANPEDSKNKFILNEPIAQYGNSVLTKVRLGQGAFRVLLTDAYQRKCAISGEKTLPVLEAAHIKPFAQSGTHEVSNGILLRSDLHKLFDTGYITITTDLKVEVSKRIKEEFENGKDYYKFEGHPLVTIPQQLNYRPNSNYIDWHNNNIYNG